MAKKKAKLMTIPVVDAADMPEDVTDYCVDNDISTHYSNDIVSLCDDGNELSEWLKTQGVEFPKDKDSYIHVGIFAT